LRPINNNLSTTNTITLDLDKNKIKDPTIIVKTFNEYFTNLGPDLAKKIPTTTKKVKDYLPPSTLNSMSLLNI
jgi:hypothetical protein